MKVSVIIPALNEENSLAAVLESVQRQDGELEILVVDGGSRDGTRAIAARHATVVESRPGRAWQMNAGARLATGEILLFLHADSLLAAESFTAVRAAMRRPEFAGGCFRLRFDDAHPCLRFFAWFTRFRLRLLHYGDQGIFVRRSVFEACGGYKEIPIMEDVDLLARLRGYGRWVIVDRPITTSARRFRRKGIFAQQVRNLLLVGLYHLGVQPQVLRRWYDDVRE